MAKFGISEVVRAIEAYAPDVLGVTATPGVVVAVGDRSGRIEECAFGAADLAREEAMTPAHVMQGGSLSKLYVATAVMQLVERGKLRLDVPVDEYPLGFAVRNSIDLRPVTLYDLLTHTSGLVTDSFDIVYDERSAREYLREQYERGRVREYNTGGARWGAPVGERFQYSSLGLATAGEVVAAVADMAFAQYVRERITGPLGMASTAFPPSVEWDGLDRKRATGYMRFGEWAVPSPDLRTATYPATGIRSTAADHTRLLVTLMNGGRHGKGQVLTAESAASMFEPRTKAYIEGTADDLWYGLSVQIGRRGQRQEHVGHGGAYPFGWWSESRAYPRLGFAITVQINAWDMTRFFSPHERIPTGIIADFAAEAMANEASGHRGSSDEMGGYVMGMLAAERMFGLLGIPADASVVDAAGMLRGARHIPGASREAWSAEGFTRGFAAMRLRSGSVADIARLLGAEAEVGAADVRLKALRWGASRAAEPMLVRLWSDPGR